MAMKTIERRGVRLGIRSRVSGFVGALASNPGVQSAYRRRALILKGKINRLLRRRSNEGDVRAYESMAEENRSSGDLYRAGEFWARFNRQHADAIWGGGLHDLRNEYFNRTFSGPEPESRQVYRALLFLYYKLVQQLDVDGFLEEYEDPEIGGTADQEIIFGRALSLDFLQSIEEAYRIRDSWALSGRPGRPHVIVELGSGYGRLAYVCRKMMPDCSYVLLDLPEALVCAQSWLSRVITEKVNTYQDIKGVEYIDRDMLDGGGVFLFLPHKIEAITDNSVDAFVNIYSLAEMPPMSIANYFRHIDRTTGGIFYTKQRELEVNVFDGVRISEASYPVPAHWRQLYRRTSTLYEGFFEAAYSTREE